MKGTIVKIARGGQPSTNKFGKVQYGYCIKVGDAESWYNSNNTPLEAKQNDVIEFEVGRGNVIEECEIVGQVSGKSTPSYGGGGSKPFFAKKAVTGYDKDGARIGNSVKCAIDMLTNGITINDVEKMALALIEMQKRIEVATKQETDSAAPAANIAPSKANSAKSKIKEEATEDGFSDDLSF